ncbi:MAG: PP2C family protein-serine/threonine phosphatase, partial [Prochloraceae cyanobacterium]
MKFYSNSNNNIKSAPLYEVLSRQNKRENNEDSYQVFSLIPSNDRPPVYILAVADGMGGHAYGEEASEQTLRKLSLSLFESLTVNSSINFQPQQAPPLNRDRLSQTLQDAIRAANEHIRRIVQQNNWGVSGSTIVVAAILEDTAVVVNLGDSPLFHYQARNNRLTQVTEDHTVAGVLQRSGMITAEMARHHEGKSRLQFFVGCSHLPSDLPTYTLKLEPNDLLLLCSDGISG